MIDHVGVTTHGIETSRRFDEAALSPLGIAMIIDVKAEENGRCHGMGYDRDSKPFFWLSNETHEVAAHSAHGTGIHIAFAAESRMAVDAFFSTTIVQGGRYDGASGVRPHYHPHYYLAFVIDPDG